MSHRHAKTGILNANQGAISLRTPPTAAELRPKMPTKATPGLNFWTPTKHPQKTPKMPEKYPRNGQFWYFFRLFGAPEFQARGYFCRQVRPSRTSVADGGVFNQKRRAAREARSPFIIFGHFFCLLCHFSANFWLLLGHFLYTEQMDAEDLGRKLLLTLL